MAEHVLHLVAVQHAHPLAPQMRIRSLEMKRRYRLNCIYTVATVIVVGGGGGGVFARRKRGANRAYLVENDFRFV